jgi:hypothetical protein
MAVLQSMAQVVGALAVLLILLGFAVLLLQPLEPLVGGLIDIQRVAEVLEGVLMYLALWELQTLLLEVDQAVAGVVPT